jgi:hypothetical protein
MAGRSAADQCAGAVSHTQNLDRVPLHGEQDPVSIATFAVEHLAHDDVATEVVSRDRATRWHFAEVADGLSLRLLMAWRIPSSHLAAATGECSAIQATVLAISASAPGRTMT